MHPSPAALPLAALILTFTAAVPGALAAGRAATPRPPVRLDVTGERFLEAKGSLPGGAVSRVRLTLYRADSKSVFRRVVTRTAAVRAGRFRARLTTFGPGVWRVEVDDAAAPARRPRTRLVGERGDDDRYSQRGLLAEAERFYAPPPGPLRGGGYLGATGSVDARAVRTVQARLRAAGFRVPGDGRYGARMVAAVRRFQVAYDLLADGVVGRQTAAALAYYGTVGVTAGTRGAGSLGTMLPGRGQPPRQGVSGGGGETSVRTLAAAGSRSGRYTFDVRELDPERVSSAKLVVGRRTLRVDAARLRRAVVRGGAVVRVVRRRGTTPRAVVKSAAAPARASRARPSRGARLEVVTGRAAPPDTPSSPAREPGTTPSGPGSASPAGGTAPAGSQAPPVDAPAAGGDPAAATEVAVASKVTAWRPVGSQPLSDAEAASRVTRVPEIRPKNEAANRYWPSDEELRAFHGARYQSGPNAGVLGDSVIPQQRHVTGRFTGTTDEILQWAAHKWGIPEDILRAVAHQESTWNQAALGDRRTVPDSSPYPEHARISPTEVYESMGLMQIKWRPNGSMHPGTEPLRWKSTAFNVDFHCAVVRFYFDGSARSWYSSSSPYGAGQEWEAVGAWYQPTPWLNVGQLAYIEKVKAKIQQRTWAQRGF